LTDEALAFVGELESRFGARRRELIAARAGRGAPRGFLEETREVREGSWKVAPPRSDFERRAVEITGPTDRKLVINALNSGADGFMADFEDANSPTWDNQIEGQANLIDAVAGTIEYEGSDGRHYQLDERTATLMVRPRGWHMVDSNLTVDGEPFSAALLDAGLYLFHCGRDIEGSESGIYFYLPKMEHHLEARLWHDVLTFAESELGLEHGSARTTVLIETLPAAFQMDEILYELKDRSYGLNAGRWDYIFSAIKCFRDDPEAVLPDRGEVKMTVPFMSAYTRLLVDTCHRRGAFAMGGMSAQIPSRVDGEANRAALDAVRADKAREAGMGFDGTWVAHPDSVAVARSEFDAVLDGRPNQIERVPGEEVRVEDLLDLGSTPGEITEDGLRGNVNVGFQYLSSWLSGRGAVGLNGLMEDAATAEISRAQIWQWMRHGCALADGRTIDEQMVRQVLDEELLKIRTEVGDEVWNAGRPEITSEIFEQIVFAEELPEFLTLIAYGHLR